MEWKKEDCPYYKTGECVGEVHVVDEGDGYISTACDFHKELVVTGSVEEK